MVGIKFLFRIWYFPLCLGRRSHPAPTLARLRQWSLLKLRLTLWSPRFLLRHPLENLDSIRQFYRPTT